LRHWPDIVDAALPKEEIDQMENCIKRGCPYGQQDWIAKTAKDLELQSTLRKRGGQRRYKGKSDLPILT
jgi:hypothetical protein